MGVKEREKTRRSERKMEREDTVSTEGKRNRGGSSGERKQPPGTVTSGQKTNLFIRLFVKVALV